MHDPVPVFTAAGPWTVDMQRTFHGHLFLWPGMCAVIVFKHPERYIAVLCPMGEEHGDSAFAELIGYDTVTVKIDP